jgi:integrase
MANKVAKTINTSGLSTVFRTIERTAYGPTKGHVRLRDSLLMALSHKGGLRACEMVGISWSNVTDAAGTVRNDFVDIPSNATKNGHARRVPMHPMVYALLVAYKDVTQGMPNEKVVLSSEGRGPMSANALQRYLSRLYKRAGLQGCSSHTGRRSFATGLARAVGGTTGTSIADVQKILGHRDIATTLMYVDASDMMVNLVNKL